MKIFYSADGNFAELTRNEAVELLDKECEGFGNDLLIDLERSYGRLARNPTPFDGISASFITRSESGAGRYIFVTGDGGEKVSV